MPIKPVSAALSVGAAAVYPYSEELEKFGNRVDKYGEKYTVHRVVGVGANRRIWLPRNYAVRSVPNYMVKGLDIDFTSQFVPRSDEQRILPAKAAKLLLEGKSFLFEAPTGWGKTMAAMDIIARVGKKTIVVVTREDIADQWAAAAKAVLGLKDSEIGHIQADKYDTSGKKIVIAMIQSLSRENRYPPSIFQEMGLAIWDETHRVGSEYFSNSCYAIPAKLRLGLSATPRRKDGRDEVIQAHIGEVQVKATTMPMIPKVIAVKSPWEIPFVRKMTAAGPTMVPLPHGIGKCMHIFKIMSKHKGRNQLITQFVLDAYRKDRTILVQSDLLEHLDTLMMMFQTAGIPPSEIGHYASGLTTAQREEIKKKRVIVACVSDDTECLTLDGWKHYRELEIGEPIAAYNLEKKVIEYQPLLGVHAYDFEGSLCHVNRKSTDILMTWNHRNVVVDRKGRQSVLRADELRRTSLLKVFAPMVYPVQGSIGEDLARLVGWVIAEGTFHDGGGLGVKISQNLGSKADEIRGLLNTLNFAFTEYAPTGPHKNHARWRIPFWGGGSRLRELIPGKKLNKFLVSLPLNEAQALFDALIDGDGHRHKKSGRLSFIQKSKETMDWFCILAMRLGYRPTVSEKSDISGNKCLVAHLSLRENLYMGNEKIPVSLVDYKGVVWCPTTKNTTWVGRRNGTVFITGNTYGMTKEATDIPVLDTLVMATPKSDVQQIAGRILRALDGKKEPVILDIVDYTSSVFNSYWGARKKWYVSIGVDVIIK